MHAVAERSTHEHALEILRRTGNPFRNFFARNPDDEVCARYHVAELYAREREQLLAVVDLYRYDPTTHSEVVPVLGNKGAGKTHLLHSIKHGKGNGWQLLVTPGTFQKGSDFLEYVLFQIIDTLLGGGKQRGRRPIEFAGEELTRRLLRSALEALSGQQKLDLFAATPLVRWARRLGLGASQADERIQWLIETLAVPGGTPVKRACSEASLDPAKACDLLAAHVDRTEVQNTVGQMRRRIYQGFARATLLGDEGDLASFLTYGFAELEYHVRPSRQDLVLALTKALMEIFLSLKVPVVVAFDQLEDLLLVRRTEDGHKISEAFFAGIVQVMHQVDGICFLVFAERGLWNRFVPSLDGYIQDRLNNPIHLAKFGTIKALRLEAPPPHLVWQVVAARLRPALEELPNFAEISPIFPFNDEQVMRVARTEPTLRDMLQQFRHLFDHLVFGGASPTAFEVGAEAASTAETRELPPPDAVPVHIKAVSVVEAPMDPPTEGPGGAPAEATVEETVRLKQLFQQLPDPHAWSLPDSSEGGRINDEKSNNLPDADSSFNLQPSSLTELWNQEQAAAHGKLEPEGALTGATRELQAGLGSLLQLCHEHGVKVGEWRLQHVVSDFTFGDHPTYGVLTIAHWAAKDGQPWKVGIGLFMGRGPGKPKDLQVKLTAFNGEPPVIDQLVLLRPADDTVLSGKSKGLWEEAEKNGKRLRLEPVNLEDFAVIYGFPRWLAAITEALPEGQPLPNLADFLQERSEKLLEQLCLPAVGN